VRGSSSGCWRGWWGLRAPWHDSGARGGVLGVDSDRRCGSTVAPSRPGQTTPARKLPQHVPGLVHEDEVAPMAQELLSMRCSGAAPVGGDTWHLGATHGEERADAHVEWKEEEANFYFTMKSCRGSGSRGGACGQW
jgi:hypothetical protein